jgi:hypothetical protein
MKALWLVVVLSCLLSGGCSPSEPAVNYVGIATNRPTWPYRYRITRFNDTWSGAIDKKVDGGWTNLEAMQITEQKAERIVFESPAGDKYEERWYLRLESNSREVVFGRLTGDSFGSSFVGLRFTKWNGEQ